MRGHHPILPTLLLTILAFIPDRGALSLPQQAPRARKSIPSSDPAAAAEAETPWRLGPADSAVTLSPTSLTPLPLPYSSPSSSSSSSSLSQLSNSSVSVLAAAVEKSLRTPSASVKQVLYPSTVIFCEHSRYKGKCREVAARQSESCYDVPDELQRTVSSVKMINIMGSCRFYKDFFCQGDFLETANSVSKIWEDHIRFHNNLYSFSCTFPLPIFYTNFKFFGPQTAVDVSSEENECAQVPSNIARRVSSLRIPEAIGSCRLYRSQGCQDDFIDAFGDIPNLVNFKSSFNDNIRSIQCPVPHSENISPKPDPWQLMAPQYTPLRPLPPQLMPPPTLPPKSTPPKPVPSPRTRPPKYGLGRSGPLRVKSSPKVVSPPEPQQPSLLKLPPELAWVLATIDHDC
ncbi:hypothetical protein CP532_0402 [Ophiocordyceps camponoti-leonardi (nom. inval.)]|nr:hypothetical protein CP532_0402 [Ophiocordyceps camponoti-leonardi (nom. inval.)]